VASAVPGDALARVLGGKPALAAVAGLLGRRFARADARLFGAAR
jgi:hypothetical protein